MNLSKVDMIYCAILYNYRRTYYLDAYVIEYPNCCLFLKRPKVPKFKVVWKNEFAIE